MKIGRIEKYILNDNFISLDDAIKECPNGYRMINRNELSELYNEVTNGYLMKLGNIILPLDGNRGHNENYNTGRFISWILDIKYNILYSGYNNSFLAYNFENLHGTRCHCLYIRK